MASANASNMTLFSLGFGNDVDYGLLNLLSQKNKGLARRIFEGSDAALQLKVAIIPYNATLSIHTHARKLKIRVSLIWGQKSRNKEGSSNDFEKRTGHSKGNVRRRKRLHPL